jgi:hypothetical protein
VSAASDVRPIPVSRGTRSTVVAGALVHYYCVAHRTAARDRSPVTIYRDSWAYCLNGCVGAHEWRSIEPTTYAALLSFGPTFIS